MDKVETLKELAELARQYNTHTACSDWSKALTVAVKALEVKHMGIERYQRWMVRREAASHAVRMQEAIKRD